MPLSEIFTSRVGNQLQRIDNDKVVLAGIEIDVGPPPASDAHVMTARLISQIPTAAFSGSVAGRDKMVCTSAISLCAQTDLSQWICVE